MDAVGGPRILQIVWHSTTGACCQLAHAAAEAARAEARSGSVADGDGDEQAGVHSPPEDDALLLRKDDAGGPSRDHSIEAPPAVAGPPPSVAGPLCAGAANPAGAAASRDTGAPGVIVRCDHADEVDTAHMLAAHGYLFVAPEHLASMAGVMKAFFDREYYPLLDRIQGRPAAVIVAAGSDGQGAVRQIERILTGWRLQLAAESVIVRVQAQTPEEILARKHLTPEQLAPARELGRAFAAGIAMGIF